MKPIDGMEMTLMSDRLIGLIDTLLLCLGLTMTIAAIAPLLESVTAKLWRRPVAVRSRGNSR
jgi:hypothetical protein